MIDFCVVKNGLKKISQEEVKTILEKEYLDDKDIQLFSEVSEKINVKIARGEHMRENYKEGI
jgi:beta-galactosidase beta subunit